MAYSIIKFHIFSSLNSCNYNAHNHETWIFPFPFLFVLQGLKEYKKSLQDLTTLLKADSQNKDAKKEMDIVKDLWRKVWYFPSCIVSISFFLLITYMT